MEKENKIIRILNIVPNMRAAGIESFIMNVYRNIDKEKIQFDFLVHNEREEFFDEEIKKMGGKIYRLTYKDDKNIFKYIKDLNSFFKKHKEYKIVHGHMQSMMPLYLFLAKINGVSTRIAHSHNGDYEKTLKGFILHVFSRFSRFFSTENWACSEVAGKYLFGNRKYKVIYNGVDFDKFSFNPEYRYEMRNELNIDNKFVILHIGRFEKQKNHKFLIKILEEYKKVNKNFVALLLGEGTLEEEIFDIANKKKLEANIKFLGIRNDVQKIMNASDCFILPSLYEGLPVVGVEAQINGLPCGFSETITREVNIKNTTSFLSMENTEPWIDMLINIEKNTIDRSKKDNMEVFDITYITKEISAEYQKYFAKGETK